MIPFTKSDGTKLQKILDVARGKGSGSGDTNVYRSGPVYEQIKADFYEKCYLCEDDEQTSIHIEHFEPHKDDLIKKFDWNNLFYACGHCNGVKGADFWPLLDCTDSTHQVWESIEIRPLELFPKMIVEINLNPECPKPTEGENTRRLLEKILTGKNATSMQMDQARKLRKKMLRAHTNLSTAIEKKDMVAISAAVSDAAPFAGMLRWHLKNHYPGLFAQVMSPAPAVEEEMEMAAD